MQNINSPLNVDYVHLQILYHEIRFQDIVFNINPEYFGRGHNIPGMRPAPPRWLIKELGQYNRENQKIGVWKHFDRNRALYKTEHFILPRNEEEVVAGL